MCGYYGADLCLCFRIHVYAKSRFSHDAAHLILPVCVRAFLYNARLVGVGLNLFRVREIPHPDLEEDGHRVLHPVLVGETGVQT